MVDSNATETERARHVALKFARRYSGELRESFIREGVFVALLNQDTLRKALKHVAKRLILLVHHLCCQESLADRDFVLNEVEKIEPNKEDKKAKHRLHVWRHPKSNQRASHVVECASYEEVPALQKLHRRVQQEGKLIAVYKNEYRIDCVGRSACDCFGDKTVSEQDRRRSLEMLNSFAF